MKILAAIAAMALAGPALAQGGPPPSAEPGLELLYRSVVTLSPAVELGETPRGVRRFIPITGGTIEGPRIKGEILPGGWDWQLTRKDGCTEIIADYFLKTDDGVVINIVNSGVLCGPGSDGAPNPPHVQRAAFEPLQQPASIGQVSTERG